jgi:hypothetical protein
VAPFHYGIDECGRDSPDSPSRNFRSLQRSLQQVTAMSRSPTYRRRTGGRCPGRSRSCVKTLHGFPGALRCGAAPRRAFVPPRSPPSGPPRLLPRGRRDKTAPVTQAMSGTVSATSEGVRNRCPARSPIRTGDSSKSDLTKSRQESDTSHPASTDTESRPPYTKNPSMFASTRPNC